MKITKRLPFSAVYSDNNRGHLNLYERSTFSVKMIYKELWGWTSGQSLLIENFAGYPPPPIPWNSKYVILTIQTLGTDQVVSNLFCIVVV